MDSLVEDLLQFRLEDRDESSFVSRELEQTFDLEDALGASGDESDELDSEPVASDPNKVTLLCSLLLGQELRSCHGDGTSTVSPFSFFGLSHGAIFGEGWMGGDWGD